MNKDLIRNIKIHNKIANEYDKIHVEIFNQKEQGRLHKELTKCVEHIKIHNYDNELLCYFLILDAHLFHC